MIATRLAPTPSGLLHLGNAWSFTLTWLAARSAGGTVRLRIDDLDAVRAQDEYLEDVFASLRWLGLDWDAGPGSVREFKIRDSQRLRLQAYHAALETLKAGGHLYACTCSRAAIRARNLDMGRPADDVYPGTCRARGLALDTPDCALRFRVADAPVSFGAFDGSTLTLEPARAMGDFVVARRDGEPAYQLASVVDDMTHGVNLVVRGLDLLPSTGAQLALSAALESTGASFRAARFWHHALLVDDAGEKLSKSRGAESLAALRARFPEPAPVFRAFATLLGLSPARAADIGTIHDLLPHFDPARVAAGALRMTDVRRLVEQGP